MKRKHLEDPDDVAEPPDRELASRPEGVHYEQRRTTWLHPVAAAGRESQTRQNSFMAAGGAERDANVLVV